MIASVLRNFTWVARFGGREGRSTFWPYAVACLLLFFVANAAIMLPPMGATFMRMQAYAQAHPDQARVSAGPTSYSMEIDNPPADLMADLGALTQRICVAVFVIVLLLAAAVARRLHDRGRSGLWGLMPLPFLVFSFMMMPRMMTSFGGAAPDLRLFFLVFASNVTYLGTLGLLGVMLAGAGQPEANRFGPPLDA